MNTPLITIGITCYNAADTIARAIESARGQDWPNKEIIIVDDASTDNSAEIIRTFPSVKLITHNVNKGPGGARQTLLEHTAGEFLVFFDDDDESLPGRISAQYNRIKEFESSHGENILCACYAAGLRIYPNGYSTHITPPGKTAQAPHGADMAAHILYFKQTNPDWQMGATPSCALMARTKTFQMIGGFDENFRRIEDLDFAVRLALAGGYFIGTTEILFRQYATKGADKSHRKNLEAEQQLALKNRAWLESQNAYFHALYWPQLRFYHFEKNYAAFAFLLLRLLADAPAMTIKHLLRTGPQRLRHERNMRQ